MSYALRAWKYVIYKHEGFMNLKVLAVVFEHSNDATTRAFRFINHVFLSS